LEIPVTAEDPARRFAADRVSSDCFVVDSRTECNSRQREKFGGDATAIDSDFLDGKPRAHVMHEMFLDKNSDDVIKFIDGWLRKNINNKSGP